MSNIVNSFPRSKPYRVIVWGPGGIGGACLREISRLPEVELVGVYVYSNDKNGKDAGGLVGQPPNGVMATNNKEDIFALEADCVLHAARPSMDPAELDTDVIRLLESGKNVISSASYHFPQLHGIAYQEKLEAACRKGGVSLHGSGVNPGFIVEKLALTATGVCNRLKHLRVQEIVDLSHNENGDILEQFGFGGAPEDMVADGPMDQILNRYYYREVVALAGKALFDRDFDRIEHTPLYMIATKDIQTAGLLIRQGTVAQISHAFTGFLDEIAKITVELHWYNLRENCPFPGVKSGDHWKIDIEGEPCSLHLDIDAQASFENNLDRYVGDPTISTYYATAVSMLQAIPRVVEAQPGMVFPAFFTHCTTDLRKLSAKNSIVD